MLWLPLVLSAILAAGPDVASDRGEVLKQYETARAKAGRDAESQVKLALWCEAHGLDAQKVRHLGIAVLTDPANAAARGLMGLVSDRGKWVRPEAVSRVADEATAAKLADYDRRRERVEASASWRSRGENAQDHASLGLWCESNGLAEQARAHFRQAVLLNPYRDATWKHLGYVSHNGRWMTRDQVAAERRDAEAQDKADAKWTPLLKKWRGWLGDDARRPEAERSLETVDDPLAIPSILAVFGQNAAGQVIAVGMLARMEDEKSTWALARLAVQGDTPAVRSAAVASLKGRSLRDYAGRLVDVIRAPMKYRVIREVGGPGMPGALEVETPRFKMLRGYDAPNILNIAASFHGYIGYDSHGMPIAIRGAELGLIDPTARVSAPSNPAGLIGAALTAGMRAEQNLRAIEARTAAMIAEANLKAEDSRRRMMADVAQIEAMNDAAATADARIASTLRETADAPADLANDDEDGWHRWYFDKVGYSYEPAPQIVLAINASPQSAPPTITSCFTEDTPVRTIDGRRPIGSIRVGDRVLAQDTATGALGYRTVTVVHRNPPGSVLALALDNGETLKPSIYHRFWLAGKGWAVARDLKPGDAIRTLGGLAKVASVSPIGKAPLFNLDVDAARTFFVGEHDALVHDNTPPDPTAPAFDAGDSRRGR